MAEKLSREELKNLLRDVATDDAQEQKNTPEAEGPFVSGTKHGADRFEEFDNNTRAIGAARFARAVAAGRGELERAEKFVRDCQKSGKWDDDLGKALHQSMQKSLQAGDFSGAGAIIPEEFAPGMIEILRSRTAVRRAGARTLPMNNGRLTLRTQTGTATGSYVGEAENIQTTEPSVGQIIMTAKKLAAVVPITNDLLRFDADISADNFVRDDLAMSLARTEDRAFIRYDGTQHRPRGLRHWAPDSHVFNSNGTSSTNVELDVKTALENLEGSDVPMDSPAWLMSSRSKNHLVNLRDANGNLVYPEIRNANPTLMGFPVFVTNNIPNNLGSGNESEVYLVDMSQAIIGEASNMSITVDSSAAYVENGQLISAFSRDETAIRVIQEHDFAMRHPQALSVVTSVTWGA